MIQDYNIQAWYWTVAGNTGQVYASAQKSYVPVADAAYVAWLAEGRVPTHANDETSLAQIFSDGYPAGWPVSASPGERAATELALRLTAGATIVSSSLPGVNATYALDPAAMANIYQFGLYANQFASFPSGSTTQAYPDIAGTSHSFSVPVFIAFLRALAPMVSNLQAQAAVMAGGGTPAWPTQAAVIA